MTAQARTMQEFACIIHVAVLDSTQSNATNDVCVWGTVVLAPKLCHFDSAHVT